jgi:ATP-dependent DNA ligase
VNLPVMPPVAPMLAKATDDLPTGPNFLFEPKWDGFRCIVFRDGDDVELGSRNERPLTRYFPEVVEAVKRELPERCVVDGEIVIAGPSGLEFEALLQRIHPAESRVKKLAVETPASFVAFDVLALGDRSLMAEPLSERRRLLEEALAGAGPSIHVTPATTDRDLAADWFDRFEGAGLDGVIAKPLDIAYLPNERAMAKIKHKRTADCVVGGFRIHKSGDGVGSLLLGLWRDDGRLQHVGVCTSFSAKKRKELMTELEPYRVDALDGHPWADWAEAAAHEQGRLPGAQSRWNNTKDLSWEPVRAELVVEVSYDHMQGDRFRHATHFVRWRPDRKPESCTYDQVEEVAAYDLSEIFGRA